jgi:hypothetical protein
LSGAYNHKLPTKFYYDDGEQEGLLLQMQRSCLFSTIRLAGSRGENTLISSGAGQSFISLILACALAVLFLKFRSAPPLISVISLRFLAILTCYFSTFRLAESRGENTLISGGMGAKFYDIKLLPHAPPQKLP